MIPDDNIRLAAFDWLQEQTIAHGDSLPRTLLENGFIYRGHRITLIGPQGIWKPRIMQLPISITTIPGGQYEDGATADGGWQYKYRGRDPFHTANVGLREVMKQKKPLIYFFRIIPGFYVPQWPVYIIQDNMADLSFTMIIEDKIKRIEGVEVDSEEPLDGRKYKTVHTIIRLHQRSFREKVMLAYKNQCSLCRLRHRELLDAAHIIADKDDEGEPIIQNGLSLCKIHHAAFDKHFLGITPDFIVKVRQDILDETDGPMLKHGIQSLNDQRLLLPSSRRDWPDKDRLAQRFDVFRKRA